MCSRSVSKHQKKFCFVSKPVCMYCIRSEGSLSAALYVYCYLEINFMFFKQQPVVVYILTSVLSTRALGNAELRVLVRTFFSLGGMIFARGSSAYACFLVNTRLKSSSER